MTLQSHLSRPYSSASWLCEEGVRRAGRVAKGENASFPCCPKKHRACKPLELPILGERYHWCRLGLGRRPR